MEYKGNIINKLNCPRLYKYNYLFKKYFKTVNEFK